MPCPYTPKTHRSAPKWAKLPTMKHKMGREIALLSLPIFILGGVGSRDFLGEPLPLPEINVAGAINNAQTPSLSLKSVETYYCSPQTQAYFPLHFDCQVVATVRPSSKFVQAPLNTPPSSSSFDLIDETGRSVTTAIETGKSWWTPNDGSQIADLYEVFWRIPLVDLPPESRNVRLNGTIGWGSAPPLSFQCEVMPNWMRQPARRLKVERVRWQRNARDTGGRVIVDLAVRDAKSVEIYGLAPTAAIAQRTSSIIHKPFQLLPDRPAKSQARMIVAWSERVESEDGQYNSLKNLKLHMRKMPSKAKLKITDDGSYDQQTPPPGFAPLVSVRVPQIKGNRSRVEYKINSTPKTIKNPMFQADIFLESDGKTSISCPLTSKPLR